MFHFFRLAIKPPVQGIIPGRYSNFSPLKGKIKCNQNYGNREGQGKHGMLAKELLELCENKNP